MHEGNKYSPAEAQLTDVKRQSHLGRPDALVEPTPGLEAIAEPLRLPDIRRVEGPADGHVPKNGRSAISNSFHKSRDAKGQRVALQSMQAPVE